MTIAATIKPQTGAPIRVQLIDDSAVVRGLTRRWLTGVDGVELVVVSTDGMQGVADATKVRPDIIILDVEMPRMDGLEALPHENGLFDVGLLRLGQFGRWYSKHPFRVAGRGKRVGHVAGHRPGPTRPI